MELEDTGRSSVWIAVKRSLRSLGEAVPTQLQRERKKKFKEGNFATFTHAHTRILQCLCRRNFLMSWNV